MKRTTIIHILTLSLISIMLPACSSKKKELSQAEIDQRVEKDIAAANDLISKQHPTRAIKLLENLQDTYPNNIKVLEALGFAYSDTGDPGLGAFYFERILQINPSLLDYRIFAAQAYSDNKDWNEAARNYEEYLKTFPNSKATWLALASTHESAKDYTKAAEAFLSAHRLTNTSPSADACAKIANLYEKGGEGDEATAWYYKTLKESPNNTQILLHLLDTEIQSENYPLAERHLLALENLELSNIDQHFLSSAREKIDAWRSVIEKQNEERLKQEAEERKTAARKEVDRVLQEAVEEVATAPVQEEPTEIAAEEDESYFQEDLQVVPEEAANPIAEIANRPTKQQTLSPPKANKPNSRQLLKASINARNVGNYDHAIKLGWDTVTKNPKPGLYWHELSQTYSEIGDFENAEMTALEALRRSPDDIPMTIHYLDVLQKRGNRTKWLKELRVAKEKFPNNPDITLGLAKAYHHVQTDKRNAIFFYEQFISLAPYHPERQRAEKALAELK